MRAWMGEPEMAIEVRTDWRPGTPIVVTGVHHGPFRNGGTVLACVPHAALRLVVERFATATIFRHLDLYWRGTLHVLKTFVERSNPPLPHADL